jgi:hypothetical protein
MQGDEGKPVIEQQGGTRGTAKGKQIKTCAKGKHESKQA